ncbi:MAG: two-component system response regulator, partial [Anaerolineales bacterium]|nr:two-component system response regulator [Anaerolineales bacterium]
MKILVVDDDGDLRDFLAMEIQAAGHEVERAANGVEAVLQ